MQGKDLSKIAKKMDLKLRNGMDVQKEFSDYVSGLFSFESYQRVTAE